MRLLAVVSEDGDDSTAPVSVSGVVAEAGAEAVLEYGFSGMYRPAVGYTDYT